MMGRDLCLGVVVLMVLACANGAMAQTEGLEDDEAAGTGQGGDGRDYTLPSGPPVCVDGKRVHCHSRLLDTDITAAVPVDGHAMIAERFLWEELKISADTHLLKRWGVFKLGGLDFKVGSKLAIREVPMVGGGAWMEKTLPVAPQIINGRLYVPAEPTLGWFRHAVYWSRREHALYIRLNAVRGHTDWY